MCFFFFFLGKKNLLTLLVFSKKKKKKKTSIGFFEIVKKGCFLVFFSFLEKKNSFCSKCLFWKFLPYIGDRT